MSLPLSLSTVRSSGSGGGGGGSGGGDSEDFLMRAASNLGYQLHQIDPTLLGFAQTLTALDLFKLQRQLQQNIMLQSVAAGFGNNQHMSMSKVNQASTLFESEKNNRVDNVVFYEQISNNCGGGSNDLNYKVNFKDEKIGEEERRMENKRRQSDEMEICNPLNLHRSKRDDKEDDSSDSERNKRDNLNVVNWEKTVEMKEEVNEEVEKEDGNCCGRAYQMVMKRPSSPAWSDEATTNDNDKFKSDVGVVGGRDDEGVNEAVVEQKQRMSSDSSDRDRNEPEVLLASAVVSDDGPNDDVVADPDCVKHRERSNVRGGGGNEASPAMMMGMLMAEVGVAAVGPGGASSVSTPFTIEHLIGRRK